MNDKYCIILPTYNERENLPLIVSMIVKAFSSIQQIYKTISYEIIIVDDNSPDNTLEIAIELQRIYNFDNTKIIKIISRSGKLGLGSAYIDGLKECDGNYIILMDADMSHHPKYLIDFIKKQKETDCDIVTGTRYSQGGGVAGWDSKRILTSRGANLLANLLLNPGVTDLTGSYRLYKRNAIDHLLKSVKSRTYVFQMEVLLCL